jgi:hypothetical protein
MLFGKLVLGFTGVVFSLYGIACFLDPAIPADFMGVDLLDGAGPVEFIAMYGGLQSAVGFYLIHCSLNPGHQANGLLILAIITAGLGLTRAIGIARLGADPYNLGAAAYELLTMALALLAWRQARANAA